MILLKEYNYYIHFVSNYLKLRIKYIYNFHCYDPLIFTHQAAYWVEGMTSDFRISYPKDLGEYYKVASEYATSRWVYFEAEEGLYATLP